MLHDLRAARQSALYLCSLLPREGDHEPSEARGREENFQEEPGVAVVKGSDLPNEGNRGRSGNFLDEGLAGDFHASIVWERSSGALPVSLATGFSLIDIPRTANTA
jgi:hypothetical protein